MREQESKAEVTTTETLAEGVEMSATQETGWEGSYDEETTPLIHSCIVI